MWFFGSVGLMLLGMFLTTFAWMPLWLPVLGVAEAWWMWLPYALMCGAGIAVVVLDRGRRRRT